MKRIVKNLIIYLFLIASNINAQEITNNEFRYKVINEDFTSKEHDFPIVRENDNYFILDQEEYLTIRENNKSEYAIVLEASLTVNSYLKTSLKLGPSKTDDASIGILTRADSNFSQALVVELNKKGEYRIKRLNKSSYIYLSGKKRKNGWVRNKKINKENKYNILEIIDKNNKITIKINNEIIDILEPNIDRKGYSGLMIGPNSKARISYFYLNSDKEGFVKENSTNNNIIENKDTTDNIVEENNINNTHKDKNESEYINIINNLNIKIEEITTKLESREKELQESISSNNETTLEDNNNKKIEKLNSDIKILEEKLEKNQKDLSIINNKNDILSKDLQAIKDRLNKRETDNSSLIEKISEIQNINKQKTEKASKNLNKIKDLENSNKLLNQSNNKLKEVTEKHKEENTITQENLLQLNSQNNRLVSKIYKLEQVKLKTSELSDLVNKQNVEIRNHIKTNNYLKEIFVYKDFELNGIVPSKLTVKKQKTSIPEYINHQDSCFTIQMGVFKTSNNIFNNLDKISIVYSNAIYTYYYGEFNNANEASENLRNLNKLGYQNIFILKKSKR